MLKSPCLLEISTNVYNYGICNVVVNYDANQENGHKCKPKRRIKEAKLKCEGKRFTHRTRSEGEARSIGENEARLGRDEF